MAHFGKMIKRLWLIWARTVDHRIGKTDDDKPDIPILTNEDAGYSLLIRTIIVIVNLITCFFIVANVIRHW
jgi:hypothetical protein